MNELLGAPIETFDLSGLTRVADLSFFRWTFGLAVSVEDRRKLHFHVGRPRGKAGSMACLPGHK